MNCGVPTDTRQTISKAFEDDGQSSAPYRPPFSSLWDNEPSTGRKADAAGKHLMLKMKKDDTIYQALTIHHLNRNNSPGLSLVYGQLKVISVGIA